MVTDVTTLPSDSPLVYAMASCHSLIKLNGELTGNPLDVKVFESIEWELKVNNGLIRSNYKESTNLVFANVYTNISHLNKKPN